MQEPREANQATRLAVRPSLGEVEPRIAKESATRLIKPQPGAPRFSTATRRTFRPPSAHSFGRGHRLSQEVASTSSAPPSGGGYGQRFAALFKSDCQFH